MRVARIIPVFAIAALFGVVTTPRAPAQGRQTTAATRYALLELGPNGDELIGVEITAHAVRTALAVIPAHLGPDVIVLRFRCDGGMLREVPRLVDLITNELQNRARVVAWVESAVSAAALTALACPEIVMTTDGTIGAAVTYEMRAGEPVALEGEELDRALRVGAEIARRTGRDPRIIRAMQAPTPLSYDLGPNGAVTLVDGTQGRVLLSGEGSILTLAAPQALEIGVSIGTADTPAQVLGLLGVRQARDVGLVAQGSLRQQIDKASGALTRMGAAETDLWDALDDARAAPNEAARESELRRAEDALAGLKEDAAQWPNVAAYLGLDEVKLGAYGEEIVGIREQTE